MGNEDFAVHQPQETRPLLSVDGKTKAEMGEGDTRSSWLQRCPLPSHRPSSGREEAQA